MKLSELKEMVDEAINIYPEDYEIILYGLDGAEFEPDGIVGIYGTNKVIFD